MGWAVVLAVAAAAAYAGGAVVQHRAATTPGGRTAAEPSLLQVLRRPLWLLGVALDTAGFALEFFALRAGTLTLVQPLLVSGLLFALPLGAVLSNLHVARRDILAAILVTVGLTVSVLVAAPRPGLTTAGPGPWLLTLVVVGLVVGALAAVAASQGRGVPRAVCFAAAAAVVNGLLAAFGKAVAVRTGHSWAGALLSWPALGLVVTAALTLTLAAAAFRAGAPAVAIGVLFAGEPVAGVTLGVVLYRDTIYHGPLTVTILVLCVAICGYGIALLSHSPAIVTSYAPTPPNRAAAGDPSRRSALPVWCRGVSPPGRVRRVR